MKRNPTLPPNFMLGYAIAAPNLQNYGSQGRQGLVMIPTVIAPHPQPLPACGEGRQSVALAGWGSWVLISNQADMISLNLKKFFPK
ncbi:hypothetical protein [Nostoc sp.]|uniref:hypothetical protein n=1 Tax=Nostoc sp. TaxID=1180 RepID=UPI002FF559D3